ncbi:MAG: hypothetical protein L0387_22930 [Acidobacteria bacterium]|nr:hypothetical protein [Acidobacteriota bacterium]
MRKPTKASTYPTVRDLLRAELKNSGYSHNSLADLGKMIVKAAGKSAKIKLGPSTLNGWLLGQRLPGEEAQGMLAAFLGGGDETKAAKFRQALKSAVKQDASKESVALSDEQPVSIGVIEYRPFSRLREQENNLSQEADFLDGVFQRFLAFANQRHREWATTTLETAVQDAQAGKILLGLLATVDRAKRLKFFPTPIRMPINAVVPADWINNNEVLREVRLALSYGGRPSRAREKIVRPICEPAEIGGLYVRGTLNLQPQPEDIVAGFDVANYADKLGSMPAPRSGGGAVPTVVADEYTCLQLLAKLRGKGTLVFDVQRKQGQHTEFPFLPSYALGIAVHREHHIWIDYLSEAFPLWLDADRDGVGDIYYQLYEELVRRTKVAVDQAGLDSGFPPTAVEGWTEKILGLSEFKSTSQTTRYMQTGSEAWLPVLQVVHQLRFSQDNTVPNSTDTKTFPS